ncbi:MAG: cell wall hydrolase [Lachnospiraceae bacterium]|nr:cell wall hydrolase [Lachnospiraceae bacterium]
MKIRNIAVLVLMFTLAGIFGVNTISVSASEENVIEEEQKDDAEEEKAADQQTVKESKDKSKSKPKKSNNEKKYTDSELRLMASIINCEAGGESYQGKLAVGIVVMNRVSSKSFPNSIKKVIYQKGQFSPVRNGSLKKRLSQYDKGKTKSKQWKDCISAAKKVLNGQRTIIYKGKGKNMKGYYFFSVKLKGARFRLGGHRFK